MGWFHINVLNQVMEQVAFDDFVLASSPCESASLAPHLNSQVLKGMVQLPAHASCGQ